MPTPHINAIEGAFAETVLMPGDPLRAKYIAENFLDDAREVTNVRNMLGFTGYYKGQKISVMGAGMGIPSATIYYHELATAYGVKNIVRIGSCGAISDDVQLGDVIVAMGACTDSKVNRIRFKGHDFAAIADYHLLEKTVESGRKHNIPMRIGNVFSADLFYTPEPELFDVMEKYGVLGVEMEVAGLYGVAAENGINAVAICTVSDHIRRGEHLTPEQREQGFKDMMTMSLDACLNF